MRRRTTISLICAAAILTLAAIGVWVGIFIVLKNQSQLAVRPEPPLTIINEKRTVKKPDKKIALVPRKIDGVLVQPEDANDYPIAVMIENAAFGGVRPQSGLSYAQVVYEVIVEGGITRFMAVYSGELPKALGPVRSARPSYLEFSSEYDALYVHAGGSPESLSAIDGLGIKELSAIAGDSHYFYRDGSKPAPHNLFTSDALLLRARRDKNLNDEVAEFDSWLFKEDDNPKKEPEHSSYVTIDFGSGPLYVVNYIYDYATNSYLRYTGDEEQIDAITGEAIRVKNVIVQIVPPALPSIDAGRVNFAVTGEGKVTIARDGDILEGVWKKADRRSRTLWYDSEGEEIKLNRGNTWIAILPETGTIDYESIFDQNTRESFQ